MSPSNFPVVTTNVEINRLFMRHPKPIPKIGPGTPTITNKATMKTDKKLR